MSLHEPLPLLRDVGQHFFDFWARIWAGLAIREDWEGESHDHGVFLLSIIVLPDLSDSFSAHANLHS
jgi:hypothetical protein